jgi:hypothetical protein
MKRISLAIYNRGEKKFEFVTKCDHPKKNTKGRSRDVME